VSRATASRVLSGSPNVSDNARDAVRQAVADLDYIPNRAARSLAKRRSDSVAFVVSESEDRLFSDPFFLILLRGVHSEVASRNRQLVFSLAANDSDRRSLEQFAGGGHIDGVILVSLHGSDTLPLRLEQHGVPVVLAGRPFSPDRRLHYVDMDNRGGARTATELLLERGCRRIATITGPPDMVVVQDRLAGYRDALHEVGITAPHQLIANGDFTLTGGHDAMQRLLSVADDVDGVFAASDLMAIGAIQAIEASGRRVPHDVAVIGFDDIPAAQISQPALTTIRQPIEEMGRQMARMLLDRLEGRAVTASWVVPTEVVRRDTA